MLATHRAMVDQAIKLFGARHFDHYDFLNAVSDQLGGIGLEHHRSTEITTDPGYFIDHANHLLDRNVFPHEIVHSWNGKYRRPAGQIVPDFRTPLRNELMWVYEGQTQLWGNVLEARSGMSSKEEVLGEIARVAAALDNQAGRRWRPLVDTTFDPIIQNRRPEPWGSFQRNEDYYHEGMLIWIEADAIIREGTRGRRGMDDFARAFFGVNDGDWGVLPYTREDVIGTLDRIYPYDWTRFLHERVDLPSDRAPLGGLERSGYRLVYSEEPTTLYAARIKATEGGADFYYSLGFNVSKDKKLTIGAVGFAGVREVASHRRRADRGRRARLLQRGADRSGHRSQRRQAADPPDRQARRRGAHGRHRLQRRPALSAPGQDRQGRRPARHPAAQEVMISAAAGARREMRPRGGRNSLRK